MKTHIGNTRFEHLTSAQKSIREIEDSEFLCPFNWICHHLMKCSALIAAAICFLTSSVYASEFGTREEAIAMVLRVKAQFAKDGPEATFKAVSDKSVKSYHDRDLYPFIYHLEGEKVGVNVAHGARPALVGKNLLDMKDQDGKYLIREMVKIARGPGSGWIDYKWPSPLTNKIEDKTSYIEKMGDYFVGVGVQRK